MKDVASLRRYNLTATNSITGALIKTKPASSNFIDNYDLAFHSEKTKEFYNSRIKDTEDQEWEELSIEDRKELIGLYLSGGGY